MADPEAASSSAEPTENQEVDEKVEEFVEPEKKRRKVSKSVDGKSDKLEQRLGGILCCAVCLDLPRSAVYQVRQKSAVFHNINCLDISVALHSKTLLHSS